MLRAPRPAGPPARVRGLRPVAACLAAGALAFPLLSAPAAFALGEDGPFELPLERAEVSVSPFSTTRVDLGALVDDSAEDEIDLSSAQLAIPDSSPGDMRSRMELSEDGTRLAIQGAGTWSVDGSHLVHVPAPGSVASVDPIAVTFGSVHSTRSLPATLNVSTPEGTVQRVRASAGDVTTIDLTAQDPDLVAGAQRLQLDGLPAGTTLTSDGSRLVVPGQGRWDLSEDRLSLEYTPLGSSVGTQPTSVRFVSVTETGETTAAGTVGVDIPVLPSSSRAESYGEPIRFDLAVGQQNISADTLALEPLAAEDGAKVSDDGTEVTVPDQGRWVLDRRTSTVVFTPVDDSVTAVAPMGVTGGDGQGAYAARAAPAILSTGYPRMADMDASALPGEVAVFPIDRWTVLDVATDSLAFDAGSAPSGASISEEGRSMTVPGEGTWSIDTLPATVTFTPQSDDADLSVTPVLVEAVGIYSGNDGGVRNTTTATLRAHYAEDLPTLRNDDVRTAPGTPAVADLLANDTPAGSGQPLEPATMDIRSLEAVNPAGLNRWSGKRLEIAGQGVFTIDGEGSLTFVPQEGFVGETVPISYRVGDSEGVVSTATVSVTVDPQFDASAASSADTAGINTVLRGVRPESPSTAAVFGSIVVLLIFSGGAILWIGSRMEADRRDGKD